jgi:hypothetical protein
MLKEQAGTNSTKQIQGVELEVELAEYRRPGKDNRDTANTTNE